MKHIKPFRDGEPRWYGQFLGQMRKVYRCVDADLTDAEHISMGITLFEPGEGSSLHNHEGAEEVCYVISGSGSSFDEKGNLAGSFVEGDILYYREGEYHRHVNDGNKTLQILRMHPVTDAMLKE